MNNDFILLLCFSRLLFAPNFESFPNEEFFFRRLKLSFRTDPRALDLNPVVPPNPSGVVDGERQPVEAAAGFQTSAAAGFQTSAAAGFQTAALPPSN
jgi:hypothetical protein